MSVPRQVGEVSHHSAVCRFRMSKRWDSGRLTGCSIPVTLVLSALAHQAKSLEGLDLQIPNGIFHLDILLGGLKGMQPETGEDLSKGCRFRCSHEWLPRNRSERPRVCPRCKSPNWDKPHRAKQGERRMTSQLRDRTLDPSKASTPICRI